MMRCGGVVLPEAVHTCLQLFTPGCNCSDSFRREGARSMRMGAEFSVTLVLGREGEDVPHMRGYFLGDP